LILKTPRLPRNKKMVAEDPALYLLPPTNAMQMLRYNDPKKKSGWIKALTLNNKE
jgi:hypothetical protein